MIRDRLDQEPPPSDCGSSVFLDWRTDMIPVCEPVLNGREMKYVNECLETNWISSAGKYISLFEEKFSQYCGMPLGVACTNCTTALHMSMVYAHSLCQYSDPSWR
jgi:dTDP-4-amino-4,6-dideoxygalactose transaminase